MGSNRQDIIEGKKAEELLRAQRDLALAIGKAKSYEEGMRVCLGTAIRISEMDCGGIYLRDEISGALDLVINRRLAAEFIASASHYEKDAPNTQLVMAGRSIYSEHLQLGVPLDEAERREGLRAIAVIPILHEDRVIGCMNIASHTRAEVPAFARDALEAIAAQIGNAIIHLRTEEALRYQAALLANMHDAIIASDEHYRLTAWNAAAESLYGWKAEEVLGRFGLDILQTEFPGVNKSERLRTIAETGHWRGEVTQARKDGTRIPVEVATIVLHDESGRITGYVSVNRDIAERKRGEEALRESEERYRSLFDNMLDGFAYCRMLFEHNRPQDFIYLDVNNAFEKLTGLKNVAGKKVTEVIPGIRESNPELFEIYGRVVLTGIPERFEVYLEPLGAWLSISVYGTGKEYFVATFDNITERKQLEEKSKEMMDAIQEERDKLLALVNSITDEVWFADAQKKFTLANPSALMEFGFVSSAEGIDVEKLAASLEVYRPDGSSRPVEEAPPLRALKGEVVRNQEEIVRTPASGELRHRQVSSAPVRNATGNIIGSVSVVRDITERKRAEEAVRKSEGKYRGLTENVNLGIYRNTVGPEGKFIEANSAIIRMFGFKSKEEFLAINVSNLYQNAADRKKFNDKMLKKGFVKDEELWLKRKDGSLFVASVSTVAVKDEQGHVKYYDGIIDDITERKQAEKEIQNLAKFPSENPNPVFRIARDGLLLYVNEAGLRQLAELHLQVGQAAPPILGEVVFQVMENGSAQVLDLKHRERMYSFFVAPVVDAGYANLYGLDITERKRAELEYKAILGTAMDGFWIIDAQGRFLDTNDAYCRLIGYSREELLKMKISDIEAKEKPKETVRRIRKIMEVGGDRFETRHRCKDGRVVDIEVSSKYNKESGDKLFVFLRDVTQRKQMGEALTKYIGELKQLSKQLIVVQEAERLRISQELHDEMGQALTMLRINIASIKESLPPGYAKGIKDRLADADALTKKLLAQIHELTLELRPHMLDDLGLVPTLRWYTERLSRRLNIQILFTQKNLKRRLTPEICTALFRIIQEALTNVAKHARAKKIRILLAQKQKFIEVIVEDDGRGFDQRKIEKRPSRARGIGLFSMKERAALLNGECAIESRPGAGTKVRIRIPWRKAVEKN